MSTMTSSARSSTWKLIALAVAALIAGMLGSFAAPVAATAGGLVALVAIAVDIGRTSVLALRTKAGTRTEASR